MRVGLLCRNGVATGSEYFKCKELRNLGHTVVVLDQSPIALNREAAETCNLFVSAKAPIQSMQILREHTGVPHVMWHNDFCAWKTSRLRWMHEAMPLVDAAVLSDGVFVAQYEHARHDLHGLNYEAPLNRHLPIHQNSKRIFAGGYFAPSDARERLAKLAMLRPTDVYGMPYTIAIQLDAHHYSETPQTKMDRVYNGNVGLSPVRDPAMHHYTSNRALLITGGNGLLYAEAFDGCEAFFSDQEAVWYKEAKPYRFQESHIEIQQRGRERAWRDYSWPVVTKRFMQSLGY